MNNCAKRKKFFWGVFWLFFQRKNQKNQISSYQKILAKALSYTLAADSSLIDMLLVSGVGSHQTGSKSNSLCQSVATGKVKSYCTN